MMYLGQDPVGLATSIPIFEQDMKIEYGEYIPENDIFPTDVVINHGLGAIPDFFLVQAVNIEITNTYEKKYLLYCMVIKCAPNSVAIITRGINANATTYATVNATTPLTNASSFSNESYVKFFGQGSDTYLKAGVKYHYIIGKYKEVSPSA